MAEAGKTGKSKTGAILITIVVMLIINGAGMYLWMRHTATSAAATKVDKKTVPAAVLHLEVFTLNIDDPEQRTYLRVGIDLGLDRDPKETPAAPTAVVRDVILNVLMATKPQDVTTVEGKYKLKKQLLAALHERVPELGVREVYFTEFLVQR